MGVSITGSAVSVTVSVVRITVVGISFSFGFGISRPLSSASPASGGETGSPDGRPLQLVIIRIPVVGFGKSHGGKAGQLKRPKMVNFGSKLGTSFKMHKLLPKLNYGCQKFKIVHNLQTCKAKIALFYRVKFANKALQVCKILK